MALVAFVVVAALVQVTGVHGFDSAVASLVQGLPVPTSWWQACTDLGGPILFPIGVVACLGALVTGHVRLALILAGVLIAGALDDGHRQGRARPPATARRLAGGLHLQLPVRPHDEQHHDLRAPRR